MSFLDLVLVAIGVSMDAFSVAICKGLSLPKIAWRDALLVGLYFGLFQAIMPLLGYLGGSGFSALIQQWDHWIAFFLLLFLGAQMIWEARKPESCPVGGLDFHTMLPLAIATSIDALAVGVTMAFLQVNIFQCVGFIGLATFLFSVAGVWIGHFFGQKFQRTAQIFGGLVLILIGGKILIEHTGIFS